MSTVDPVFDLSGKVVVLTGAAGTIGRTVATALAERGAKLVLVDVEEGGLEALASRCAGGALTVVGNVTSPEDVARMRDVAMTHGRVDVLINNHQFKSAGAWPLTAEEFPLDGFRQILDVNLTGTFLMCREFGRQMLAQGKGSIINLASTYGVVSSNPALYAGNTFSNPIAYTASKGGVVMLSKYLGAHWAGRGVRVNALTPHGVLGRADEGFVQRFSQMSPTGRTMQPDEIVGAVLFLASDASSYVTGSNLLVEGGWTAW